MTTELTVHDFTDREVREEFIKNNESSLYSGTNEDGLMTIVMLDKGVGMTVKNLNAKGWYECHDYDADGFCEATYFEKANAL